MVEGAPLLREYTGNGIEGSNPFVSATCALHRIFLDCLDGQKSFDICALAAAKFLLSYCRL